MCALLLTAEGAGGGTAGAGIGAAAAMEVAATADMLAAAPRGTWCDSAVL